MNCSPLRGVRVEPLLPSLPSSPLLMQTDLQHVDLDTSLDDEFALQQGRDQHEREHADADGWSAQPTLRQLVDEPLDLSRQSSAPEGEDAAVAIAIESEEMVEECSRSVCCLPTPTPMAMATPVARCTPQQQQHESHAQAVMHAHTMAARASPAVPAPQLFTPPTRGGTQRFATTAPAAAAPAVAASPLVDYRGTPIDTAPRRNLMEGRSDTGVEWSPFRAAAAASLFHAAPQVSLHPLASPSKSPYLHRLEAQMAASLLASPLPMRPHDEYDAAAYAEHEQSAPVTAVHDVDDESSLMHVEQTQAEEADDAIEELGKHAEDDEDDDEQIDASRVAPQRWGSSPHYDRHSDSPAADSPLLARSPLLSPGAASPFISPAARAHETRHAQSFRHTTSASASPFAATQPAATAPLVPQRVSAPAPAPDSQPWSSPVELSKAAAKKFVHHSRYGQHAASEKKKRASLLATTALPKITPPTLDQWQREADAKRTASASASVSPAPILRNKIQSNLTLIKGKAASKRTTPTAPNGTAATTAVSAKAAAPRSRPPSSTSSSLTTLSRHPLAPLPLNSVIGNPWSSGHELAGETETQTEADAEQPFHTPLKRTRAPVCHTPATTQPPAQTDRERLPSPPPVLHHLSPSLPPPAQPAQTYRAIVDGVHIVPPALSWVAAHQIQPDRIHANLRYITTAYAHAD